MSAYLKIIRPVNLLMVFFTMYLFRWSMVVASPYKIFYVHPVLSEWQFLVLVLATMVIAAGGYVINDIYDVDIDAVNKPEKQVVGKLLTEQQAYSFYKVLCGIGVVLTLVFAFSTMNFRLSAIPVIIMVVLNFYAHSFKRQLLTGNLVVAVLSAFTIFLIALFESGVKGDTTANERYVRSGIAIAGIVYGAFAFLTTMLREIVKDMEDVNGDRQYDCRTIPIVWGMKAAKITAFVMALFILALMLSFVFFFPSVNIEKVHLFILILLVLPLALIMGLILYAHTVSHYRLLSIFIKVFMCIGIATLWYFRSGTGPYIFVQYVNYLKKLI